MMPRQEPGCDPGRLLLPAAAAGCWLARCWRYVGTRT
jgi:hypothetical protein